MRHLEQALEQAVRDHHWLAVQAGRPWYDEPAVLVAAARVKAARRALHPLALAGADSELHYYGLP